MNSIDANLIKNGTIDDLVVVNVPNTNVGDLISRQAAIDAVADLYWMDERLLNFKKEIDATFDKIKALPSAQQWTPCSEELPEAGVRYQVTFESGEVGYADFRNKIFLLDGSVKENVWEIERYYEEDGEVIAWMPLPDPYKAERSEDGEVHSSK